MVADADGETLPRSRDDRERPVVRLDELARMLEKGRAVGRKLHAPGRAFDEPEIQPFFEPLELQADRRLGGLQRFGGAGETAQLGDADEGSDRLQVEGAFSHFKTLSLK